MRKSDINLVTQLKGNLLEFPGIVNSLEQKDGGFVSTLLAWIKKNEDILASYNISEVSELAGLRSKVLAAKLTDDKKILPRKAQFKMAAAVLYELQNSILHILKPVELKVEECRELVRQLLLIVSQAGLFSYQPGQPFETLINEIWQFISTNEQLKAGAVKLKTVLIQTDIQLMLAEEINLEDF
jgi:hypothetical protein